MLTVAARRIVIRLIATFCVVIPIVAQVNPAGADAAPAVAVVSTPNGGWYVATSAGGVWANNGAPFAGALDGVHLNRAIVGVSSTPSGRGYWMAASDGGVFSFGDATFFGSLGSVRLNRPIVGMASSPSGRGYWMVASDGGIFSFGDASFQGSTGAFRLASPVVGMASTPDGRGYWLAAGDGGVFAFGDAPYRGRGYQSSYDPVIGIAAAGWGYRLVAADGQLARSQAPSQSDFLNPVNSARAAAGLGSVGEDAQLDGMAVDWAKQLAASRTVTHRALGGFLGNYHVLSEALYAGPAGVSASDVVTAWLNSPGHRQLLLDPAISIVGVGVAISGSDQYVVMNLAG
jgi:uncharacterized protein YkwD